MNRIIWFFCAIITSFLLSCNSDCNIKTKNDIKDISCAHIADLEQINAMILKNILLLQDSCCQNIGSGFSGNACNDPDSVTKNYFYPATKHLLNKYLPKSESETLKLIDKLSPNKFYSNEDIVIPNFDFRIDSTVRYPVFNAMCGDSITEHWIIYQKGNEKEDNFYSNDGYIKVVKQKNIKPDWIYYIIQYSKTE